MKAGAMIGRWLVLLLIGRVGPAVGGGGNAILPGEETEGSLQVRGMEIGDAIRLLVRDRGLSVILDPGVEGTVNVDIHRAKTSEILELLTQTHGLSYERFGNVLLVRGHETRTFTIEMLSVGEPGSKVESTSYEWDEIRQNLERLKSSKGELAFNERAGVVTATDDPRVLNRMERYVNEVRQRLSRQVQIETRVIEVRLGDALEAGIDWTILDGTLGGGWRGALTGGVVGAQRTSTGDGAISFGILKPGKVDLLLDALAEQTHLRVVARPRLVTAANRPASFQVTERVPYITKQVSREGGVAFTDFQVEFADAGVRVDLTAQPAPTGLITLYVHPVISNVTGYTPSLPDLGPQPIVDVRETNATIVVEDAQTVVISGLIQERRLETTRGVPLLSRLPLLGTLFRHTRHSVDRVELVILLTPTLLDRDRAAIDLERERSRMQERGIELRDPD